MEVVQLKKLVEEKDSALTDVRLDALEKAREAEILRETVTRLKVLQVQYYRTTGLLYFSTRTIFSGTTMPCWSARFGVAHEPAPVIQ